jgi:signal transduction histidine kinase
VISSAPSDAAEVPTGTTGGAVFPRPDTEGDREPPRSEQAAAASRRYLAEAVAALRAMDRAEPDAARDRALSALDAAVRHQDAFLHAAAHDLRNPLTALRGQAQLLGRRARRDDPAGVEASRVRQGVAAIEEAADRTALLIDQLLDAGWLAAWEDEGRSRRPEDGASASR